MFKLCKFSLYDCKKTTDSFEDDEEGAACTSKLQKWHKKGGGSNIAPQPVMEVEVNKTKLNETRSRSGIKPLLYDARVVKTHSKVSEMLFKEELKNLDPNMSLAHMALEETNNEEYVKTRFGKSQVGSFLSYQVAITESNFQALANIAAVERCANAANQVAAYPHFPLRDQQLGGMGMPDHLSAEEREFVSSLQLDEPQINTIEFETREQASCEKWKKERKYRFTASKFHLISKRQRNHDTLAATLMSPSEISSKYVQHGLKYESVALQQYEKFMHNRRTPVQVHKSGFVVSKDCPVIGATPDARIIDPGCADNFGLAEVKCPYTKFHVTPMDACSDSKFCMHKTGATECMLKENHPYYFQVQGQMGVTGARWCDFIIYTSKGLYVQRIPFNLQFLVQLKEKVVNYYFTHFLSFALQDKLESTS